MDGRLSGYVNTINMWTGSEVFILIGYDPASLHDSCPTFQDSVVISSSGVQYPMNNAGTGGYRNIQCQCERCLVSREVKLAYLEQELATDS